MLPSFAPCAQPAAAASSCTEDLGFGSDDNGDADGGDTAHSGAAPAPETAPPASQQHSSQPPPTLLAPAVEPRSNARTAAAAFAPQPSPPAPQRRRVRVDAEVAAPRQQHARPPAMLLDDILWCVTDDVALARIDCVATAASPSGRRDLCNCQHLSL